jgi:hypothetical protein
MRRIMQSVIALLREKVSFFKASWMLSPKSSLLELSVRSYMACYARVLVISNKDKQYNINMSYTLLSYLLNSLIGCLY